MELKFMQNARNLSLWDVQLNDLSIKSLKTLQFYIIVQVQASGPWGIGPGGKRENSNHRCSTGNALGVNTLSISRIKLKLHFVHNVETDTKIGEKDGDNLSDEHIDNCCSATDVLAGDGTGFSF
jgi:hypothetical protein